MSSRPPYDPELRRDTPLARKLIARIRAAGPIDTYDYMDACLNDPEYGYYRTRTAIGRRGDFITAPEVSQVFGELIGLWCAVVWQQMGSPQRVNLIELGAGRGTLLADALRAVRLVPGFRAAVSVHVLDGNPALIEMQRKALAECGVPVTWHETLDALPTGAPSIWIANEFLDTLPVRQLATVDSKMARRAIGLDDAGRLAFVRPPGTWISGIHTLPHVVLAPAVSAAVAPERVGPQISESQNFSDITRAVRKVSRDAASAALFIDYGQLEMSFADTLQAVRDHHHEHVLASPGEADLSCQVSFGTFASDMTEGHGDKLLTTDGPVTQSEFLGRLGIMERASKLMAANPAKANEIEMGVARLMAPQGMGTRFLALGVRCPSLPPLPGFGT